MTISFPYYGIEKKSTVDTYTQAVIEELDDITASFKRETYVMLSTYKHSRKPVRAI